MAWFQTTLCNSHPFYMDQIYFRYTVCNVFKIAIESGEDASCSAADISKKKKKL